MLTFLSRRAAPLGLNIVSRSIRLVSAAAVRDREPAAAATG
jgi:hypothetical protein